MAINIGKRRIGNVVVTSIMGHSGGGDIFPLNLLPSYRYMAEEIRMREIPVIAKSATRFARKGNYRWWAPWLCIKQIHGENNDVVGLINSFGLTNKGVEACAQMIKKAQNQGFNVISNYFPELFKGMEIALKETGEAIEIYDRTLGRNFRAFEYNASCGNSGESLQENEEKVVTVAKHIKSVLPQNTIFITKVSPVHRLDLSLELQSIGVDVIHGVNSFPHSDIFPGQPSPLGKLGGSYSGEHMFSRGLKINSQLRAKLTIPMIMGCGISNMDHVEKYAEMIELTPGASMHQNSLSICSVLRTDEKAAIDIFDSYYKFSTPKRRKP